MINAHSSSQHDVFAYAHTTAFEHGLTSAQTIWSRPNVLPLSALYIYINQICIPEMLKVEQAISSRLMSATAILRDLERTRAFICGVVGLSPIDEYQGGIRNPNIVTRIAKFGERHRQMPMMKDWMMIYMGQVIAIAPLKVIHTPSIPPEMLDLYTWYMRHAWSVMGVRIQDLTQPIYTDTGMLVEDTAVLTPDAEHYLQRLINAFEIKYGLAMTCKLWDDAVLSLVTPIRDLVQAWGDPMTVLNKGI